MISFRTNKRLRLILLVAALILLVFLSWGEDSARIKASNGEVKQIKWLVDKALDDFVSRSLSKVEVRTEDVAKVSEIQSLPSCPARAESRATMGGPPSTCSSLEERVCQLLAGKRVLFVGPETTHFLHTLWLDVVEGRQNRTHTCPGREYCTFHHICRGSPVSPEDSDTYDRAGRKKKIPSDNLLRATRSALLQYTYSTTLYAASNKSDMLYQFPLVDLETGAQQVSQYWLRRARKADVIILSRSPVPAPVSTYTVGPSGNWTFASALCSQQKHFPASYCRLSLPYTLAIAALDMTFRNFLPLVMETIGKLATDTLFQGSLHVWHGNWIIQPSCAVKRLSKDTQLLPDFWSCTDLVECQIDPWAYLHNVQVYLQDRILPRILPYYGIIYLPLSFPIPELKGHDDRSEYVKDCIREPWPGFPEELVQAFLIKLNALLTPKPI